MKKIPTLYVRDPDDRRWLLTDVTPGCEWVLEGEGRATRKYDGTCVALDEGGRWWARREVKPGKNAPDGWRELDHDETTGKRVGWEPVEQSAFAKFHAEAVDITLEEGHFEVGTYELCGPKINGNPEDFKEHTLVPHGSVELDDVPLDYDDLRFWLHGHRYEGVVWHHPDGCMAKIKQRDFPPFHYGGEA